MTAIRALFLDLDNTLFATKDVPHTTVQPILDAVIHANYLTGALDEWMLSRVLEDCWWTSFDHIVRKFDLPDAFLIAVREATRTLRIVGPLSPYPDVCILADIEVDRVLVTTGYRALQESKMSALNIRPLFDYVLVDDLSEPTNVGKEAIFRELLIALALQPWEALVIGDSAASEILAGNRLGIPTVQILRPGVKRSTLARFHINSLIEVPSLMDAIRNGTAG